MNRWQALRVVSQQAAMAAGLSRGGRFDRDEAMRYGGCVSLPKRPLSEIGTPR